MRLGIMQPYFLPYIGYWQVMNAVDKYIIYDDVNFIKGGWINRNRILVDGKPNYINVKMEGASPYKLINEVRISPDEHYKAKTRRMVENAYKKAPFYDIVMPLFDDIYFHNAENLAEYNSYSFRVICEYLGISTELIVSSRVKKDKSLKGQDKILDICRRYDVNEYINTIAGEGLYSKESFSENGMRLWYLKTNSGISYKQYDNPFEANLSILDVMMFNSVDRIREMLEMYTLV